MKKTISYGIIFIIIALNLTGCIDNDADGDGVSDATEQKGTQIIIYKIDGTTEHKLVSSNPNKSDTDDDGLNDYEEYMRSSNPSNADTDGDGLNDYEEVIQGSSLYHFDTWDINVKGENIRVFANYSKHGANPTVFDSDNDGLTDYEEYLHKTDPTNPDTDDDGTDDYFDPEPCWNLQLNLTLNSFKLKNNKDTEGGADLYFIMLIGNTTTTTETWAVSVNQEENLNSVYTIDFADISAYDTNTIKIQIFAFDKDKNSIYGDTIININDDSEEYSQHYDINNYNPSNIMTTGSDGELNLSIQILKT